MNQAVVSPRRGYSGLGVFRERPYNSIFSNIGDAMVPSRVSLDKWVQDLSIVEGEVKKFERVYEVLDRYRHIAPGAVFLSCDKRKNVMLTGEGTWNFIREGVSQQELPSTPKANEGYLDTTRGYHILLRTGSKHDWLHLELPLIYPESIHLKRGVPQPFHQIDIVGKRKK